MDIYTTIEEKYLQAVEEVSYGEIPRGLQLLNEIIANDPLYARAHYQLGKLYYYEINDYRAAGFHFKTCVELDPLFPDVYFHFLNLVVFLNMEKQVYTIIEKALLAPGINPAAIFNLQGLFFEKNKNWTKASLAFKKAYFEVTNKKQKASIEESLQRVEEKIQKSKAYRYELTE